MTSIRAGSIQPLKAPQVNVDAAGRVVARDSDALLRSLATAGASRTIAESSTAWNMYAADAGILNIPFFRDPPWTRLAGSLGELERVRAIPEERFSEAEPGAVRTFVVGDTAPMHDFGIAAFQATPVNTEPLSAYRSERRSVERSRDEALADIRRQLDNARATYAQRSPRDVAIELGDEFGAGQLGIARAVGVTPTAVRKWRRGEAARPEYRDRLSHLAAFCSLLGEVGLHDPAGWIDIPISSESTLTPIDLFCGGRADLAVLLGAGLADPQETLDVFNPDWRVAFAPDRDYEVVTLTDGSRSVVPVRNADR